jgi:hypothetical protein
MRMMSGRRSAQGQIIVIAALAMVAIVAMVGLVIDGGAVFAQQRLAQNGADAASTAGALVVAENLGSATDIRDDKNVYDAVKGIADKNDLKGWTAFYTDDTGNDILDGTGNPIPVANVSGQPIPTAARGVRAGGHRDVPTTFSRVVGFDNLVASAEATVVAGKSSGECVLDEQSSCALLPITFPVQVYECDSSGNLIPGYWVGAPPPTSPTDPYWPIVGAESLPTTANPSGDTSKLAILPLCKSASGGSGAFGWLDLDPSQNLPNEIEGPLTVTVDIPDWFQTQAGNPNSVEDELSAYIHKPVLIPLNNGACREDPGATSVCPAGKAGVDPVGNNTWYYVHTLGNFYIDQVLVKGSNVDQCASAPGKPLVPITTGGGFLGCLKGWFINFVTSGPIVPGDPIVRGQTSISIQLIK